MTFKILLRDYHSADILEVRVIDGETLKILGTSDPDNQGIVGQKSTDTRIRENYCYRATRQ